MGYNSVEEYVDKAESNRNNAVLRALLNNSGGGGDSNILVVNITSDGFSDRLDKTWQEIFDADAAVIRSKHVAEDEFDESLSFTGIISTVSEVNVGDMQKVFGRVIGLLSDQQKMTYCTWRAILLAFIFRQRY